MYCSGPRHWPTIGPSSEHHWHIIGPPLVTGRKWDFPITTSQGKENYVKPPRKKKRYSGEALLPPSDFVGRDPLA
ncbi:hypothetical protein V5799_016860 [Amblyomma americanum]|uniref:Uncharacterized protein n=1 Tax=Amblyomma americanum TaxID=6943 RepID=A0AAQ4F3Y0_AMBAM